MVAPYAYKVLVQQERKTGGNKALGHTVNAELIEMLEVGAVDWCTFSAAVDEIGANWILCCEQCD